MIEFRCRRTSGGFVVEDRERHGLHATAWRMRADAEWRAGGAERAYWPTFAAAWSFAERCRRHDQRQEARERLAAALRRLHPSWPDYIVVRQAEMAVP